MKFENTMTHSAKAGFLAAVFAVLVAAPLVVTTAGCGSKGPETAQVTGTITLDGKPLELIQVEFWPEVGARAIGKTDDTGKYSMTLDGGKPGASVGLTRVLLKDTWPMKDNVLSESGEWIDKSDGKRSRISSKYYDAEKTPLTFTVKRGEANVFDVEVDPRKK